MNGNYFIFDSTISSLSLQRFSASRISLETDGNYKKQIEIIKDPEVVGVLKLGDREIPGGDLAFPLKIKNYWTLVNQSIANTYQGNGQANQTRGQGISGPLAQPDLE